MKNDPQGGKRTLRSHKSLLAALILAALLCGCTKTIDPQVYVKDLGAEEERPRKKAIDELIRMHEDAVPAVTEALNGAPATEAGVRLSEGAIAVLSKHRTVESLKTVGAKTKDPSPKVRLAAINGVARLAEVRKSLSTGMLEAAVSDADSACVRAATKGLGDLNLEDAASILDGFLKKAEGVQAVFAAEALYYVDKRPEAPQYILDHLGAEKQDVSEAAQQVATHLGTDKPVQGAFIGILMHYQAEHPEQKEIRPVLDKVRESLFAELEGTLEVNRERAIMAALGTIADAESCGKLIEITTTKGHNLPGRVAAAGALGDAASSGTVTDKAVAGSILATLKETLNNEEADNRIRIACAISLCQLREVDGITYLLDQLESLEAKDEKLKPAEVQAMTELRVRAQDALTTSGEFVVPYLIKALETEPVGETTAWAAARTLGDLRVKEAVPRLVPLLTASVRPRTVAARDGDPVVEIPVKVKGLGEGGGETLSESLKIRAVQLTYVVAALVTFAVLGGACLLILFALHLKKLPWGAVAVGTAVILLISFGVSALFRHKAGKALATPEAGAIRSGFFSPTRETVLEAVCEQDETVPQYGPAVRIAVATALGRIGGGEGQAALKSTQSVEQGLRDKLARFVERREYNKLVPKPLKGTDTEDAAVKAVADLGRLLLREHEAVLFYIRQALKEAGAQASLAPAE